MVDVLNYRISSEVVLSVRRECKHAQPMSVMMGGLLILGFVFFFFFLEYRASIRIIPEGR